MRETKLSMDFLNKLVCHSCLFAKKFGVLNKRDPQYSIRTEEETGHTNGKCVPRLRRTILPE